jgi:prepilin-type processing-associated H-X9-DG protein
VSSWNGNWFNDDTHGSNFVNLLPYMEEQGLYDSCDFTRNTELHSYISFPSQPVYKQVITMLICPSDDHQRFWPGGGYNLKREGALSNYGFSIGNQKFAQTCGSPGENMFGNGPIIHGDSMSGDEISGVFSSMFWSAGIKHITDGSSHTICMGEVRPACALHLRSGWMHINSFWIGTTGGINTPTCPDEPGYNRDSPCNHEFAWATSQAFKSLHPNGANVMLADGSATFVSEDIDYITLQKLGDRRDGFPVEPY